MSDKTAVPKETASETASEKGALQSKKFIAFLLCELGFFVLMGIMLFQQEMEKLGENMSFIILAITGGILACAYIGGQALVDKYVRVAALTLQGSKALSDIKDG